MVAGRNNAVYRTAAVILALAVLMAGPAWAEGPLREHIRQQLEERRAQRGGSESLTPGTHEFTLEHQGRARRYLVHVPRSHGAARAAPLVFAFHGGGGDAGYMADERRYGLVSKSEQAGFVVVFPNGYSRLPRGRLATWNAGNCCGDGRDAEVDDVGFVRAILAALRRRINVDPARIFATGMSNGGMLSHRLACDMADVFAAVAPVAGTDNTRQCAPARPVSVLQIHALNDDHVLFHGGAGKEAFRDRSKVTEFVSVPESVSRWVARNRCDATPVRSLSRPGAWCDSYRGCAAGVQVQLCVTETGGHSWPGADEVRRGKEPASKALSANDLMWEFFQANGRDAHSEETLHGP